MIQYNPPHKIRNKPKTKGQNQKNKKKIPKTLLYICVCA